MEGQLPGRMQYLGMPSQANKAATSQVQAYDSQVAKPSFQQLPKVCHGAEANQKLALRTYCPMLLNHACRCSPCSACWMMLVMDNYLFKTASAARMHRS